MTFEYVDMFISLRAQTIFVSFVKSLDLMRKNQIPAHLHSSCSSCVRVLFYQPFDLHQRIHSSMLCVLTFVSLYVLSFIGLAPMNGTTHIRATQTRTWWKTISRCSIVSGLELGLSCSKVLASSCGCCCSVELKLFVPHCSQGLDLFFNKASGKRKRPLKVFSRIKLMVNAN